MDGTAIQEFFQSLLVIFASFFDFIKSLFGFGNADDETTEEEVEG